MALVVTQQRCLSETQVDRRTHPALLLYHCHHAVDQSLAFSPEIQSDGFQLLLPIGPQLCVCNEHRKESFK